MGRVSSHNGGSAEAQKAPGKSRHDDREEAGGEANHKETRENIEDGSCLHRELVNPWSRPSKGELTSTFEDLEGKGLWTVRPRTDDLSEAPSP